MTTNFRYYDPVRNWKRIQPHLKRFEPILVRDFNRFTYGRWGQSFEAGMVPRQFESCDWDIDHRGREPRYWQYVKHAACHWLVNHSLELAQAVMPASEWRILSSELHSTVYDGHGMLFDFNFCALGIEPEEAYLMSRNEGKGRILKPGKHLRCYYAGHWSNDAEKRKRLSQGEHLKV
ncbi:hypothetical protein [Bradyrhizobium sp. AUGA SZCCT0160]|uniref:hypothetical protein n=1 Tax=Bradyrhizobium sp. AUGA SZCCT0160 TaxID=2807662 RepID=UPI001BA73CAD|nr:hypothetical protein [Bradyrhizobium sp. AUGA SZCCT0160]MBR1187301.1 hypothetical protein [Bradyrhizobium sp. AUGA SZCCT0160]